MANIKIRGTQRTYGVSENEALEIKRIWKDDNYRTDQKIDLGPISFKKGDIQLIEMDEIISAKRGIDLSDPIKREEVRQFEKEFNEFIQEQPKEKRTFEHYLKDRKIVSFSVSRIAQSGIERFDTGKMIIHDTQLFNEIYQKYNAIQAMKTYEEKNMPELKDFKQTEFLMDEINVKDIPF